MIILPTQGRVKHDDALGAWPCIHACIGLHDAGAQCMHARTACPATCAAAVRTPLPPNTATQVRQVPGGVARNMAEAISLLVPPQQPAPVFISIVGDDAAGNFLTLALKALRLVSWLVGWDSAAPAAGRGRRAAPQPMVEAPSHAQGVLHGAHSQP